MPVHNTHMVFFSMRQLLNNNKLGNLQRLMCAQNVRNAQPIKK